MSAVRSRPITVLRLLAIGAAVVLLAPQAVQGTTAVVGSQVLVSSAAPPWAGTSPGCRGADVGATTYPDAEVEPRVAVNPSDDSNIIGAWQQDRTSNGASNGLGLGVSHDGGATWTSHFLPVSHCAGGNASNGGDYARATDPWVSISPDGTAYFLAQGVDFATGSSGVAVYRSTDGGDHWGGATTLIRDTNPNVLNDKISITADSTDSNFAYAVWDRLVFPNELASAVGGENALGYRGPGLFARTTDGGATWEPTRINFDPGEVNQIIGAQIVTLPDGTLVEGFDLIYNFKNAHKVRGLNVAVIRSTDKGVTWSKPIIVSKLESVGVTDPETGTPLRTEDVIPDFTAGADGSIYAAWQDARFSSGDHEGVVLSKSTDGGVTWSAPTQINQEPTVPAFLPTVKVLVDGTVGVTYYDLRNNTPDPGLLTDVWFIHSHDGGSTWSESRVSPTSFDYEFAPQAGGYFLGDYEGLGASSTGFAAFYAEANSSTSNRSDIFFNPITP